MSWAVGMTKRRVMKADKKVHYVGTRVVTYTLTINKLVQVLQDKYCIPRSDIPEIEFTKDGISLIYSNPVGKGR